MSLHKHLARIAKQMHSQPLPCQKACYCMEVWCSSEKGQLFQTGWGMSPLFPRHFGMGANQGTLAVYIAFFFVLAFVRSAWFEMLSGSDVLCVRGQGR